MSYQLDSDWNTLKFVFFLYLVTHHRHDMPVIDNRAPVKVDESDDNEQKPPSQQDKRPVSGHRRRNAYFQPRKEKKTSWQTKPSQTPILVN